MTVYKNNRGKWCVDVDFVHPDGRTQRIRKTSPVQTKRDAERYEQQLRKSLLDGTYRKGGDEGAPTVAQFQTAFLEYKRSKKGKDTSRVNFESLFRRHLIPLFGDKAVDSFGKADRRTLLARFAEHESHSRYNNAAAAINGLIALYHDEQELPGEPFKFERLKIDEVTKPFYEFGPYAALIVAARHIGIVSELCVLLPGDAGLRRSEMWALTPGRCRMRERKLVIEVAETISGKERFLGRTKGNKLRDVDMTDRLHDALSRFFAANKRERIIAQSDGSPFDQGSFQRFMANIQRAAGLEPTGEVHILRHTFCSHLAIRGVPVTVIQKLAGHEQLNTTLGYMHLAPGDTRRAIDRLEEAPPA